MSGFRVRQKKSVVEGDFAQIVVAAGSAAVACTHVDFEKQTIRIGLERAEFGHVFRGLPVHDLAVVQSGLHEHGGIGLCAQIGVGAVALHVEIIFGNLRIAPLLVFADGERQRSVEHGVEHIHERDMADHDAEKVGPHVGDRAHQQSAGAAAFDDELFRRGESLGDQNARRKQ